MSTFIFFQVLQVSVKSYFLQEVLFDCSRPPPLQLMLRLLLLYQVFSHIILCPYRGWDCWLYPLGPFEMTVMHMALLGIHLSFNSAQSRPVHCHPLSLVGSLPNEAACKRQFPSPVVAKGRSRLQLVHTVDHQFRRPGTEAHFRTEFQKRQRPLRVFAK